MCASLHIDADGNDASVVLMQGKGNRYQIVGVTGRPLTATEKNLSCVEKLLVVALHGMRHFSRITLHVPVTVVVPK